MILFSVWKFIVELSNTKTIACGNLIIKVPARKVLEDSVNTRKGNTTEELNYHLVL